MEGGIDPVADRARARSEQAALAEARKAALTVGELLDDWLERKRRQISSADRTASNLRQLRPDFLGIRVAELTAAQVGVELQAIAERRSADMAHRVLGYVRSALDDVLDDGSGEGLIETNPASHPLVSRRLAPRERTEPFKHLTDAERLAKVLVLIERCRRGTQGSPQVRALMWLQPRLFTRPSELRTIRWSDVNFEESRLEIRGEETKSGRAFLVPLARQCLAVFRELEKDRRSDHVFHSPVDPGRPLSDGALRPAMRRAGIGPDMIVPHGFRHTASTMLNERRFSGRGGPERVRPDAIEAQLAHVRGGDKVRATYNRAEYVDERTEFMQAWADWLETLVDEAMRTSAKDREVASVGAPPGASADGVRLGRRGIADGFSPLTPADFDLPGRGGDRRMVIVPS